ncbi:SCYL2, partial [Cervus elaphus hippelaphus]
DCLAFCTEPVFASLANVLGNWENLPSPVSPDIKDYKLYDVETKYGLLQVSEGLSFLHSSVKMVHGNITPENIILNKSGAWKIMGFDFCVSSTNPSEQEPKFPCKEWDPNLPSLCLPNPEYLAPEYILSVTCETASDMYSLGTVMYAVFNKGKPVFEVNKQDIYKSFSRQLDQLSRLGSSSLTNIPEEVREHVKLLLNVTPTVRPDADQMTKIPFFDDVGAVTLQYFDTLFQRDNLQKSQFFKGLPKVLPKLPKIDKVFNNIGADLLTGGESENKEDGLQNKQKRRVIVQRILPCLTSEFVNPDMVPFVLPNVLLIAEECTKEEYVKLILPELGPVFKQQEPIQILLIFLQKMDLLLTKTPPDEIKNSVLPMVYRALEAPSIQIQVRVNSLVCLGKILEYLDKWFVLDDILPFLQQIPSKEPAVLMGILDYPSMKNALIPRIKNACLQTSSLAASLTLEEKQKLAKEQEQAQKLKSQQPLKPQVHTPIAPVKQTKDLTDTLMDNMSSLTSLSVSTPKISASSSFTSVPSTGLGMMFSTPIDNTKRNLTNGLNANMGFQTSGFNMPVNTNQNFFSSPSTPGVSKMTLGAPSTLPNFSAVSVSPAGGKQTQQRPTDMSALNNLFGPQKPKVSMNQLSQQKPNQWLNQFVPPQGSPGMGSSVMGTQVNVLGQSAFGMQANPFFNPQNFAQPPTTMTSSSSASNDLKDLFGNPAAQAAEPQLCLRHMSHLGGAPGAACSLFLKQLSPALAL